MKKIFDPAHADPDLERLVFFSDAVMAIAITLLAIDLKLPVLGEATTTAKVWQAFVALAPHFLSFLISFTVIGVYWYSHHRYFRLITRMDGSLTVLNMLFLLSITLIPFVSGLFGQYYSLPIGPAIYASAMAFTGFSMNSIWRYASYHRRLLKPEVSEMYISTHNLLLLAGPVAFLFSIPLAWVSFTAMIAVWWMTPLFAVMIVHKMTHRTGRLAHKKSAQETVQRSSL